MLVFQPVHAPQTCDNTTEYRTEYENCQERKEKIEYKTNNHTVLKKYPSPLGYNCITYAKSKGYVPHGMGTLKEKLSKIKSYEPRVGKIGITTEGPSGHAVVIEKINEETVVISEGNWAKGFITWREIPRDRIVGYL